jgi:putative hydrolase of the HAD superfamily
LIRSFLFDLGNVLVTFSHERMFKQLARVCGVAPGRIRKLFDEDGLLREFDCGRVTPDDVCKSLEAVAGKPLDRSTLLEAGSNIFERNAPMDSIVEALAGRGFRLVLFSNTCAPHWEFVLKNFPVVHRFHAHVLSYEVGAMKPEAAMFAAALTAIDCEPGECVYTDDIAEYVAAGRRHGFRAIDFKGPDAFHRELAALGVFL